MGPQAVAFWRYSFALPLLFLICVLFQRRLPAVPNRYVIIAGVCFALDIGLWHWGLSLTTVANATFIVNLGNIGVGLTAWIFLKETPTRIWALAVVIALSGAAALSLGGGTSGQGHVRGDILSLGAAIMVSLYIVASKLARRTLSAIDTIFWLTFVEILVAAIWVILLKERFMPDQLSAFYAPLFLALIVQILGQGLIVFGLGHTPTAMAGVLILVQPVVAAAISWRLFDEPLAPLQAGGAVLILIGIVISQGGRGQAKPISAGKSVR